MEFDNWMIEHLHVDGLGDDRWESLGYSDTTNPNLPELYSWTHIDFRCSKYDKKKLW